MSDAVAARELERIPLDLPTGLDIAWLGVSGYRLTFEGVSIFIDPAATMFLLGSEMDYVEDKFHTGFTFKNPNEKGRCGCGESFHV